VPVCIRGEWQFLSLLVGAMDCDLVVDMMDCDATDMTTFTLVGLFCALGLSVRRFSGGMVG
jgi:hypothetical protein